MASVKRGDVLVARRRLGFGVGTRREHFVVLQSDILVDLDSVVVAPLDEDLPLYATDPLVARIARREAGTTTAQVVLVAHMTSVRRERFDAIRVGRLRATSMAEVSKLVTILLEL